MRAACGLACLLLLGVAAVAANVRLYLKEGGYHVVREYQVQSDRVRFYSVERSDWEEIPLELVDLKRTEAELKERQAALAEETRILKRRPSGHGRMRLRGCPRTRACT